MESISCAVQKYDIFTGILKSVSPNISYLFCNFALFPIKMKSNWKYLYYGKSILFMSIIVRNA